MSGGIAYVYDADGTFDSHCNKGMVGLEEPDEEDLQTIKSLIQKHLTHTGSTVARKMLDTWATSSRKFVKVMPTDFKRVLLQQQEARKKEAVAAAGE